MADSAKQNKQIQYYGAYLICQSVVEGKSCDGQKFRLGATIHAREEKASSNPGSG
jgi:hypothetical protein